MKKIVSAAVILVTVFALMVPVFASAQAAVPGQTMWVNCANGKTLNLREEPTTGSRALAQLECGTSVEVIDNLYNGWLLVDTGRRVGYVMAKFLVDTKPGKYDITEREDNFVAVRPYIVYAKALNNKTDNSVGLRVKPNKTSTAIRRLTAGDELQVIAEGRTWSKVVDLLTGKTGYVANDYICY